MFGLVTQAVLALAATVAGVLLVAQTRRLRHAQAEAAACRAALLEMEVAYDQAPLGMTVLDRELRYLRINQMLAEMNGVSAQDHFGKTIYEVVPEIAAAAGPLFQEVMRTGAPLVGLEFEGPTAAHPDEVHAYRESVYPVRDRHGNIVGVSVAVEDITERKRLLTALHESEQRERLHANELESVMDATPAAVFIAHDRACLNVTFNAETARLLHLGAEESPSLSVPGPHGFEVCVDGVALALDDLPLQLAASSGRDVRGKELEVRFANGDVLPVLINAVPLRGQNGEVIGAVAAFVDITAQKKATQELERQARHKDEFLAVLAHELRNPLAAIQAGLELLALGTADNARLARTREIMQRQMAHVVHLIDDLLDVARISSGKLELKMETVCVREIVDAAVELCRAEIERGGHHFHVVLSPEPLYVHADRVRLTEVICNLLHNAAKYTPRGGNIELMVEPMQGQALFRIADDGVGIAPESLSDVFTMFVQAEVARAQRKGGLGVGLALASRIVELHGGSITADSAGPGRGSTFTVRLPVVPAPAASEVEREPDREPGWAPLRILVLDDNADAADTLGAALEARGHTVRLAYTGRSAIDALEQFDADVGILDIGLPDISGHEVAREIRERYPARDMLLVALSGWGNDRERRLSEQAGIDIHLTKPVTMETIEQAVLSRRGKERHAAAAQPD